MATLPALRFSARFPTTELRAAVTPGSGDAGELQLATAQAIESSLMPEPAPHAEAQKPTSRFSIPTFSDPDSALRDEALADTPRSRRWARAALPAANHFALAGQPRRAGLYRLLASRAAARAGREKDSLHLAEAAMATLEPGTDHAAAAAAILEVARGLATDQPESGLLAVVRAEARVAFGTRADEKIVLGRARLLRAQLLEAAGRIREASESAAAALAALRLLPSAPDVADAITVLGNAHWRRQEIPEAMRRASEALEIRTRAGDRGGQATSHANMALAHWKSKNVSASLEASERAVAVYGEIGDRIGEARALGNMAVVTRAKGDRDGCAAIHERIRALQQALGERHHDALVVANQGIYARLDGDFETALARCAEARSLFEAIGSLRFVGSMDQDEATALYLQDRHSECADVLERAASAAERSSARDLAADITGFRAIVAARLGQHDTALTLAARARREGQQVGSVGAVARADTAEALARKDPSAASSAALRAEKGDDAVAAMFAYRIATDLYEAQGSLAQARIAAQEEAAFGQREETAHIVAEAQSRLERLFGRPKENPGH